MKIWHWLRFAIALWGGKFFLFWYCRTGHVRNDKPGMAAMRLYGDFLRYVAKPKLTIVVTGTNGKTTISALIAGVLRKEGKSVSFNDWGANHHAGVARCLLDAVDFFNRPTKDAVVVELDELISPLDLPALQPDYVVISNLARDSMLRNAHPAYIAGRLKEALAGSAHSVVIVNGDDPLSCFLGEGHRRLVFGVADQHTDPLPARADDFSICPSCGGKPVYRYRNYRQMGEFYCPQCGLHAPRRDYLVSEIDRASHRMTLRDPEGTHTYPMVSWSLHNAYNLAPVIALFRDMGVPASRLSRRLEGARVLTSRESFEMVGGIKLITHIAKGQNPTAVSTVFEFLAKDPSRKEIILILDEVFDSPLKTETISWIYDTDYEFLCQDCIQKIVLGGARYLDHRLRLLLAGVPAEKIVCLRQELDTADYVDTTGIDKIYILHDVNAISRGRKIRDLVKSRIRAERGAGCEN